MVIMKNVWGGEKVITHWNKKDFASNGILINLKQPLEVGIKRKIMKKRISLHF